MADYAEKYSLTRPPWSRSLIETTNKLVQIRILAVIQSTVCASHDRASNLITGVQLHSRTGFDVLDSS